MLYLLVLIIILGILLLTAVKFLAVKDEIVLSKIIEELPQTQCGRCGFAGCKDFAENLLEGKANPNMCVLIDEKSSKKIAKISGVELDSSFKKFSNEVALIDESICIGCTKCIQVCPTDCIIGSVKMAHTVMSFNCSGCRLCVEQCPTKAIKMVKKTKVEIS